MGAADTQLQRKGSQFLKSAACLLPGSNPTGSVAVENLYSQEDTLAEQCGFEGYAITDFWQVYYASDGGLYNELTIGSTGLSWASSFVCLTMGNATIGAS